MRSYIIQPEKRHEIWFGLLKKVINQSNKTIYITDRSIRLPFSKNKEEELCFNSFGFTYFALKNM